MRKLLTLSFLIVLIDQGTKLAVKGFNLFGIHHEGMERGQTIPVIGDLLHFTFVENPGMAFGLDFGMPLLLGLFSIGAAVFLVYLLRKARDQEIGGFHIALAMILGGAVGNLIDRVFYGVFYGYAPLFKGRVVDFISVDMPDFLMERFYVFNIADSAVSVGIILLLLFYPKYQKQLEEEKAMNNELPDGKNKSEQDIRRELDEGEMLEHNEEPAASPLATGGLILDDEESEIEESVREGNDRLDPDKDQKLTSSHEADTTATKPQADSTDFSSDDSGGSDSSGDSGSID